MPNTLPTAEEIQSLLDQIEGLIGLSSAFPQSRYQLDPPPESDQQYGELWQNIDGQLRELRELGFPFSHPNLHETLRPMWAWCWTFGGSASDRMSKPRELYAELISNLSSFKEILCEGAEAPVEVLRELRESARRTNELFVIMALRSETQQFYSDVVRPAAEAVGLEAILITEREPEVAISEEILSSIRRSLLVLCDLSFERPNCYFEAGFAKASFRRVLFTCRSDHDPRAEQRGDYKVHFDVDQFRITWWSPNDLPSAQREIESRFQTLLEDMGR